MTKENVKTKDDRTQMNADFEDTPTSPDVTIFKKQNKYFSIHSYP